ncbi:MAG: DUF86 domain-containing protein [Rubrivivax sp.]|jgi:uncharacterized protein YutE (UPF0331/DUF86 family)|nr:DUF86 domain-containing protein [Rubrivivax sp.]
MDNTVVDRKLEALRVALGRVRAMRGATPDLLAGSADRQDVVVLNLSRAVQLCVDISAHLLVASGQPVPATMGDAFSGLAHLGLLDEALAQQLRRAVGFRNLAVHNYEVMDWRLVHALADDEHLRDFERFAAAVLRQRAPG